MTELYVISKSWNVIYSICCLEWIHRRFSTIVWVPLRLGFTASYFRKYSLKAFLSSQITKTFYIRDNLHLKTLTPEILANMCDPFLKCAAFYHALKKFVEERRNLLFGPTHQVSRLFVFLFDEFFLIRYFDIFLLILCGIDTSRRVLLLIYFQ